MIAVTQFPFASMSAVLGMRRSGCYEKRPPGSWFRFIEKGGKRPKVFITKSSIRVTVRFLAVSVGEGRVEEGSRCTAVPSELTLLEQGSPALEMIAIFVQCLEILEDDLQSADNVP